MKFFRQFIAEAVVTLASKQANQMGLRGDGHGDWYDQQGKLVAKTVGGKLQVFKGRTRKEEEPATPRTPKPKAPTQQIKQPELQVQPTGRDGGNGVVVVLGRFNPPGTAHEQLLRFGANQAKAKNFDYKIYPSRIKDKKTNPLNPTQKIKYLRMMFPDYAESIVDSDNISTIFDVLSSSSKDGYDNIIVVVGSDRVGEFQSLAHRTDGQGYDFKEIQVIPAGVKDPDSDNGGVGTSGQLRIAAAEGNFQGFSQGIPSRMKVSDRESLFTAVAKAMGVTEDTELWEIAPEYDMEGLRINYKQFGLYPVGSLVESMSTGVRGRVLRRGANHLICVTSEGLMFKSWLQNIREVFEVGTDKYREALQRLTPGQPVVKYTKHKVKETMSKTK